MKQKTNKMAKFFSGISKWGQGLLFTKTMKIIKKNKKQFFFILLFDFIMILALTLINAIAKFILPDNGKDFIAGHSLMISFIFIITYTLIYLFAVIAAYSFVKYCVLDLIRSMFRNKKFSLNRYWRFAWLNIKIIGIPFIAFMIVAFIISLTIERQYAQGLILLILLPVIFFYYPFMNLCQSLFYKGEKNAIRKAIAITFPGFKKYGSIYVSSICAILAFVIASAMISAIAKIAIFNTEEMYYLYYPVFDTAYKYVIMLALYLLMSFNRISFYRVVEEK